MTLTWNDELQCHWLSWSTREPKALILELPPENSAHGPAVIRIGKAIMPDVDTITVYAGGMPDIIYAFTDDSRGGDDDDQRVKWRTFDCRGMVRPMDS
jgi:hypothetical protein